MIYIFLIKTHTKCLINVLPQCEIQAINCSNHQQLSRKVLRKERSERSRAMWKFKVSEVTKNFFFTIHNIFCQSQQVSHFTTQFIHAHYIHSFSMKLILQLIFHFVSLFSFFNPFPFKSSRLCRFISLLTPPHRHDDFERTIRSRPTDNGGMKIGIVRSGRQSTVAGVFFLSKARQVHWTWKIEFDKVAGWWLWQLWCLNCELIDFKLLFYKFTFNLDFDLYKETRNYIFFQFFQLSYCVSRCYWAFFSAVSYFFFFVVGRSFLHIALLTDILAA